MPFSPLPGPFLDEAGAVASRGGTTVELGCGDGALTARLAALGLAMAGLDRVRPGPGVPRPVVGDALTPPLAPGRCGLVVAANLVRHLAPRRPGLDFLVAWAALPGPGGGVYLLEDAPRPAGGAAGNYGRLQRLLARIAPAGRGPLLAQERVAARARALGLSVAGGAWTNTWPLDAGRVLDLLGRGAPRPGGEVDALMRAIARDGLACGPAWWLRLARKDG